MFILYYRYVLNYSIACCRFIAASSGARLRDSTPTPVLCYAMLCYAMLCYAMLCYAMLCYAMLCYAMPSYVIILGATFIVASS